MLCGSVFSDFYLDFLTMWGFADGSDPTGNTPLLPNTGDKALVQLLYAGDNGIPDYYQGSTLYIGGGVEGDDILLDQFVYENTGQPYEEWALFYRRVDVGYLGNGKVYGRIFNTEDAGYGSKFYVGHVQTMSNIDKTIVPPLLPEMYDLGQAKDALATNRISVYENAVIPEPSTTSLLGIGAITFFLTNRRLKKSR